MELKLNQRKELKNILNRFLRISFFLSRLELPNKTMEDKLFTL
jgi:hypothetical protein